MTLSIAVVITAAAIAATETLNAGRRWLQRRADVRALIEKRLAL